MSVAQTSYRYWRSRGCTAQSAITKARTDTQPRYNYKPNRLGAFATDPKQVTFSVERECLRYARKDYADKVLRLDHTGHYADAYQDEIYRGIVIQLSAHKGKSRFLAAYEESQSGYVVIERNTVWDDQIGAARRADQLAERNAEEARDYDSAWQAGTLYGTKLAEIRQIRKEALEILASRKRVIDPVARKALGDRVLYMVSVIQAKRQENDLLKAGEATSHWFNPNDPALMAAFVEGLENY